MDLDYIIYAITFLHQTKYTLKSQTIKPHRGDEGQPLAPKSIHGNPSYAPSVRSCRMRYCPGSLSFQPVRHVGCCQPITDSPPLEDYLPIYPICRSAFIFLVI